MAINDGFAALERFAGEIVHGKEAPTAIDKLDEAAKEGIRPIVVEVLRDYLERLKAVEANLVEIGKRLDAHKAAIYGLGKLPAEVKMCLDNGGVADERQD